MTRLISLLLLSAIFTGCVQVPALISSDSVRAQYVGKHERLLIEEHGLPDQSAEDGQEGKICSWTIGTSSNTVGVYYGWGVAGASSSGSTQKLTAYVDKDGIVTDLKTNGYSLGNEDEVAQARRTNSYLGTLYGLGILSFLLTLSLY